MKKIQNIIIILFAAIIAVPIITMNNEKNVASDIDNRVLAENPYVVWKEARGTETEFDLNKALSDYLSDRIGLRNQLILSYTEFYDKVFHEMKHPTYTYGQDGYVFFHIGQNVAYSDFHDDYVDMMVRIKNYCDARNVPCYFMFEPSKITALQQYLPKGVNYNREWADLMLEKMRAAGVEIVDNTELLASLGQEGVAVFNKQFDAGHWNDYGAFYGINHLLQTMRDDGLNVQENDMNDFEVTENLQTTLLVSEFPIEEMIPSINTNLKDKICLTDTYASEVYRHPQYRTFNYYINEEKADAPRLLCFQGSYINGKGYKYLANSFSEYIGVHDYQNTMNLDYYYNIFKPDVVVVEVAEYACSSGYFDMTAMENMDLNPVLNLNPETDVIEAEGEGVLLYEGQALSKVQWPQEPYAALCSDYYLQDDVNAWLLVDDEVFDMRRSSTEGVALECTIDNSRITHDAEVKIAVNDGQKTILIDTPVVLNMLKQPELTGGVTLEENTFDTYNYVTDVQDNKFSYVLLQLQNSETGEVEEQQGAKSSADTGDGAVGQYTHTGESGEYALRFRGNSNLADEYITYHVQLEKGETYYYQYTLNKFSDQEITVSKFFFGK